MCRHGFARFVAAGAAAVLLALMGRCSLAQARASAPVVVVAQVRGPIMAPMRDYVTRSLAHAIDQNAECLLVEMDTPGGEMEATRSILKLLLNTRLPVVVYVTPRGARAASAGAMIGLAAHVLAMSPGTNIGAAHPVASGGADIPGDMKEKVVNDSAALMRTVAQMRGRSAKWAEDIVRKSISNSETEARALGVADIVAEDRGDLLRQLDGRVVKTTGGTRTLATLHAEVRTEELTWAEGLLMGLFNPNVALILVLIAAICIMTEFSSPGAIVPGVVGGIALLLAFYSFSVLSANGAGIALLLLSLGLFIADLYATTHGVLTAGGIVAFVSGALLLFSGSALGVEVSLVVVVTLAVVLAGFFGFVLAAIIRSHRRGPGGGPETLIGMQGEARTPVNPTGKVFVDGTHWTAVNIGMDPIRRGDAVTVESRDGLTLKVRRTEPPAAEPVYRSPSDESDEQA